MVVGVGAGLVMTAATAVAADPLEEGFLDPPLDARTRCFWWWLNGNVTPEAITRDLEEMKAKGFGGGIVVDAGGAEQRNNRQVPAGPMYGTPAWRGLFKHAVNEAGRLGLELSLNIQSGWNLGGPDVTPAEAAKQVAWSETRVHGPADFRGILPQPKARDGFYRDIAVLALPMTGAGGPRVSMAAVSEQPAHPAGHAGDGDPETFWVSEGSSQGGGPTPQKPLWLQAELSAPTAVGGLSMRGRKGYGPREGEVQVSSDGRSFTSVATFSLRDGEEMRSGFRGDGVRFVRLRVTAAYDRGEAVASSRNVQVAEMTVLNPEGQPLGGGRGARPIRQLDLKAGFHELGGSAPDCRPLLFDEPGRPGEEDARLAQVLDLTTSMSPAGELLWQAPPGEWRVLRFGCTPTGARVSTASGDWQGAVLDYMSREVFDAYWKRHVQPLLDDVAPHCGKALRYVHTDSWECGGMNWTPGFERFFRERRGYDPLPWLPVIAGRIIESREASNAFLADFRKTIADAVADHHYGRFAELARERRLGIHPESAGPHAGPLDGLKNYGRGELMLSESWVPSPHRPKPENRFFVKQAASAAHIYGRRLVGAEMFTSIGPHWDDVLGTAHRPTFDHEICDGLNLAFVHTFTCSPREQGLPGQEYFAGTHFNPQVTWWEAAGAFVAYLNRNHFLAQVGGRFVADALYYYGDHVPNIARRKADDPAKALPGFDYDVINEERLLSKLGVSEGRLALPGGHPYRVLVLPDHQVLSLAALRKIGTLVEAGATVLGPRPLRAVSLEGGPDAAAEFGRLVGRLWGTSTATSGLLSVKSGRVVWGETARAVLLRDGTVPDFEAEGAGEGEPWDYIHYDAPAADYYFVRNPEPRERTAQCRFRGKGRQPELWDCVDGTHRDAAAFAISGDRTTVPLTLPAFGSLWVVFRRPAAAPSAQGSHAIAWRPVVEIAGPWDVAFDPKWGGPPSVRFDRLVSWTDRPEDGLRVYSGKATYRTSFNLPAQSAIGNRQSALRLSLGQVEDLGLARVRLNGRDLGVVWCAPHEVDITGSAQPAGNRLEIEVWNSWRNRLIADRDRPEDRRLTRTNIRVAPEWKPRDAGLLGPVRVLCPALPRTTAP